MKIINLQKIIFYEIVTFVTILFCFNTCFARATNSEVTSELAVEDKATISEITECDIEDVDTDELYEDTNENFSEEAEEDTDEASSSDVEKIVEDDEKKIASPSNAEDYIIEEIEEKSVASLSEVTEATSSDAKESLMMNAPRFGATVTPIYMYLEDGTTKMHYTTDSSSPNVLYNGGTIGNPYSSNNVYNYLYYSKGKTPADITEVIIDTDLYPDNARGLFSNFSQITGVTNFNKLHLDNATSIEGMFTHCDNLTSVDMSNWNLSNVQYADYLFAVSGITNVNMSVWSGATNLQSISCMFMSCNGLSSVDLNALNTSSVQNFSALFYNCANITTVDLTSFNTSAATTTQYMFSNCSSLQNIYVGSGFTLNGSCNSADMFTGCTSLPGYDPANTDGSMISTYTKPKPAPAPTPTPVRRYSGSSSGGGGGGGRISSLHDVNMIVLHAVKTNLITNMNVNGAYNFVSSDDGTTIVKKSWVNSDIHAPNSWYLVDSDGTVVTGFAKVSGKFYYMSPDKFSYGKMLSNGNITFDGNIYTFDENGVCTSSKDPSSYYDMDFYMGNNKGLVMHNGYYYYFDDNGNICTGLYPLNGALYYFSNKMPEKGKLVCGDVIVDGIHYFCDPNDGGKARVVK